MNEITIKENKEKMQVCDGCCATNYHSIIKSTEKIVDVFYDVRIGRHLFCLCGDCLKRLLAAGLDYKKILK